MDAFYDYVSSAEGAFRLVFESDLTNEPAVRERVDRVTHECAAMITHVIHDDTGLPDEQSRLLAVSLVGMAQVSARFWLADGGAADGRMTREEAATLVAGLAWRGIRGYPRTDEHRLTHPAPPRHTGGPPMEVKIGVQNAPRELTIDADIDAEHVEKLVAEAVAAGGVLTLTDTKGRRIVVPAEKIAYVEITTSLTGTVGFRS